MTFNDIAMEAKFWKVFGQETGTERIKKREKWKTTYWDGNEGSGKLQCFGKDRLLRIDTNWGRECRLCGWGEVWVGVGFQSW